MTEGLTYLVYLHWTPWSLKLYVSRHWIWIYLRRTFELSLKGLRCKLSTPSLKWQTLTSTSTAVSVWKPSFVHGSSTISAFVSLLNPSRDDSYRCCDNLTGRIVRGHQIRVSRVNGKEAFHHALAQFENDAEGNKEWQRHPNYTQYRDEQYQLVQHLRLSAAFKPVAGPGTTHPFQGLPYRSRSSFAPGPSSLESERKDKNQSGPHSDETDVTMEDRLWMQAVKFLRQSLRSLCSLVWYS